MQHRPPTRLTGNKEQGVLKEEPTLSCVVASPIPDSLPAEAIIVDAVRCWRNAIDRHLPVLPILFARLEARGAGFLAPAIDALLALHEAWSGQRFRAAHESATTLTDDERRLLGLLETAAPPQAATPSQPGLARPLHIAVRSTRILIRWVLGCDLGKACADPEPVADKPASQEQADPTRYFEGNNSDTPAVFRTGSPDVNGEWRK